MISNLSFKGVSTPSSAGVLIFLAQAQKLDLFVELKEFNLAGKIKGSYGED